MLTFLAAIVVLVSIPLAASAVAWLGIDLHNRHRMRQMEELAEEPPVAQEAIGVEEVYLASEYETPEKVYALVESLKKKDPHIVSLSKCQHGSLQYLKPVREQISSPDAVPMPKGLEMTASLAGHAVAGAALSEAVFLEKVGEEHARIKEEDAKQRKADEEFYRATCAEAGVEPTPVGRMEELNRLTTGSIERLAEDYRLLSPDNFVTHLHAILAAAPHFASFLVDSSPMDQGAATKTKKTKKKSKSGKTKTKTKKARGPRR